MAHGVLGFQQGEGPFHLTPPVSHVLTPDSSVVPPISSGARTSKSSDVRRALSERWVVLLVGAIQFVNILDFMIVMPLGPDFATHLGIPTSQIGIIGGSYTAAAAVAGILGSVFLDRFDRRTALSVAMLGLVAGTALGGCATGITSMIVARVVAGCFGGPATSLAMAVIADCVPVERRGKALGAVMGAFAFASVIGVPVGLELSQRFGWRSTFFAVAALGLLLSFAALWIMPPMRAHLNRVPSAAGQKPLGLINSLTGLSLLNFAIIMLGVFAVVPNLSAFVQHNLGFPRDRIGLLYMVGGIASFVTMRITGALVDRVGAARLVFAGTGLFGFALIFGFIHPVTWLPVMFVFTLFMLSGSVRMVPMQTLSTRVPRPEQRARFMSAQSSVQHFASALGAMGSAAFLTADPDGSLQGMDRVAYFALGLACLVPFGAALLERRLAERDAVASTR